MQSDPDTDVDEDGEYVRDWVAEIFDRVLVSFGEVASQVLYHHLPLGRVVNVIGKPHG